MPSCVNVGTRAVKCDDITALAFSNDGQRVYLAGEKAKGGFFRDWLPGGRLSKGETLPAPVQSMAVSPDDRWLAVGLQTCPGDLRLFDTKKKSEVRTATQLWPVRAIAYSPQGDVIATSSGSEIKLWRASLEPAGELNNHRYLVAGLCFSPDGRTLATVSTDQIVRLWDVESRTQRASLKSPLGHTSSVAIAPCGKSIAVGGTDAVIIWSPDELAGTS
jgi:WD40 repeat protein